MNRIAIRSALTVLVVSGWCYEFAPAQTSAPFPEPRDTQPAPEGVTNAKAALAAIKLPPGFRATLFAAEPAVRQPIALATDPRGRLWVAENYTYAQAGTNFDLGNRDRIVILDDNNQDGEFDRRTVFWDQASKLTSVEIGFGGVWALCPPHLLFIPDRNGDDIPDSAPEVMLDGWDGDAVRHNIANGLRWGPDGWLYGRHGILATSNVGTPETPPELRTKMNVGIWRFHPTRRVFETVAHGTTNPWGMDWDEHGQFFFINTVIGHLWHVVPGIHLQRMYGEDLRPNLYELVPQTADHFHWDTAEVWSDIRKIGVSPTTDQAGGGHAHSGMLIYQGGVWPRRYHNTVFAVNLHGRRMNNDRLARRGSSYVATHEPDFMFTTDPWFRGVETIASADGGVFIADWSDIGECHENDGVHRTSGRIFKIVYDGDGARAHESLAGLSGTDGSFDLTRSTDAFLIAAQMRKNEWLVRQARRILQERAVLGKDMTRVHAELLKQFASSGVETQQLRAMWSLYVTNGASEAWLLGQLKHPSEHVRSWSMQLLVDDGELGDAALQSIIQHTSNESSGLVLLQTAATLQRLRSDRRLELAEKLVAHHEFATDVTLPLMVWYGIEPAVSMDAARSVRLAAMSTFPKVREFIARRLTTEIEKQPAAVEQLVALLGMTKDGSARRELARGMAAALRGWRKAPMPAGWKEIAASLHQSSDSHLASLARELSVVFGDGRALDELRTIAETSGADLESRRAALRTLATAQAEGVNALLQKLLGDRDLQVDAIRALATNHDDRTSQLLIERLSQFQAPAQREAINTLVSRKEFAKAFVAAIADGRLDRNVVSTFHVRQLSTLGDEHLTLMIATLWPELKQRSAEKTRQIAAFRDQLTADRLATAIPARGRATFQRVCANCHVLFGQGSKVGPDLTGAQRTNLTYLLENIVDPSATVAENFRMSVVIVDDGRVLNGVITERTDKTLTVATPTDRITLSNEAIEEIRPTNLSIMPEGQLELLSANEIRDLVGYLMSPTQVTLP